LFEQRVNDLWLSATGAVMNGGRLLRGEKRASRNLVPPTGFDTSGQIRGIAALSRKKSERGRKLSSADADERAPDCGETRPDKHDHRVVAECPAIAADAGTV
jgi:hypothetical protein